MGQLKKNEEKSLIKITELNRKHAIVLGRSVHIIESIGSKYFRRGIIEIRPQLKRGMLTISDSPLHEDFEFFITKEEDFEEWKGSFNSIITTSIKKGEAYFNPEQKLTQYKWKK
jgi:hypothetical protein